MTKKKQLCCCACALAFAATAYGQSPDTEIVVHTFRGSPDGKGPDTSLIGNGAGNLYGTTQLGGMRGFGAVYEIDTAGRETVLYSFKGGADGANPSGGLIRDTAGNLYGGTTNGGAANAGVVYKVDAAGRETVLYTFTGGADGRNPNGVIRDPAGNLYGTTEFGGAANSGVVYKLDAAGQQTVLYSFTGGADGATPFAGVVAGDGNLYGTTRFGGTANVGVVFKVDATGLETVLYSFTGGPDGAGPYAGVIRDAAGNLYGTTFYGGTANVGVVYKVDATGQETVLYTFNGGADGAQPYAGVIRDAAGNLYGTTYFGGTARDAGVVYKVDAAGQETVLYSFMGAADGRDPEAGVFRDAAGDLYGTTYGGGKLGAGVVFKLKAAAP